MTPFARSVLDAVDGIPPGSALTYGDVAELVGAGSARAVGMVLSRHGAEAAWWRVVHWDGRPPEGYVEAALRRLGREGCPVRGGKVDLDFARRAPWPADGAAATATDPGQGPRAGQGGSESQVVHPLRRGET